MKCSDCKLWKTSECRNNPEAKDLDYAETFACFTRATELSETSGTKFKFTGGALLLILAFVFFIVGAFGFCIVVFGGPIFYQGTLMGNLDVGLGGKVLYSIIWIITTLAIAWGGWLLVHPKKANTNKKFASAIMKCSDCKLWETKECRNNPDGKDLGYADTFACFVPKSRDDVDW